MAYERPCDQCRVYTHVDLLEKVDFWPLERVCPGCAAELRADEDDPTSGECECDCDCSCCERARARADAIRLEAETKQEPVSRGISPLGMELLGWTEEDLL